MNYIFYFILTFVIHVIGFLVYLSWVDLQFSVSAFDLKG